jgi:hypothetical protein
MYQAKPSPHPRTAVAVEISTQENHRKEENPLVEVTVNSIDFCPNYVQEQPLCTQRMKGKGYFSSDPKIFTRSTSLQ